MKDSGSNDKMPDAGCCVGMTGHSLGDTVSQAALERGFKKVGGPAVPAWYAEIAPLEETRRGFLTRPNGWER